MLCLCEGRLSCQLLQAMLWRWGTGKCGRPDTGLPAADRRDSAYNKFGLGVTDLEIQAQSTCSSGRTTA